MLHRRFLVAAFAATLVSGCASMSAPRSVADTIAAQPSLSTLNNLIVKAGLTSTLQGTGPFTVFAPTNEAFQAVPAKTMEGLAQNPALLREVLTYHVLAGKVMSADVRNGSVKTVNGASVALARAGDFVTVEESMVQTANIVATNGVIHTVDRVMLPPAKK